jgi:hypothetical protein
MADHPRRLPGMREGDMHALIWFTALSSEEQRVWIEERMRENEERRRRECEIRGHIPRDGGGEACPHCDTPYDEIEQAEERREAERE